MSQFIGLGCEFDQQTGSKRNLSGLGQISISVEDEPCPEDRVKAEAVKLLAHWGQVSSQLVAKVGESKDLDDELFGKAVKVIAWL